MRNFNYLSVARFILTLTPLLFLSASVSVPLRVVASDITQDQPPKTPEVELAQNTCLNPKPKAKDDARNRGSHFVAWNDLDSRQQYLLQNYFGSGYADNLYTELTVKQDGKAATFLAVTTALKLTRVTLENNEEISALDMISRIREIRTDRLILKMDVQKVNSWRKAGGKYAMNLNKNHDEVARVKFATHTLPSGGLHCGYDLNWYTKANKTPHLHWNMRFSDGQADVHLDGYPAYLFGVIPNPVHLTYQNSDVRYWFNKYVKKYGSAGFSVSRK